MTTTAVEDRDLKDKCAKGLAKPDIEPMEKLRLKLLSRGANGIKSLGRVFKNMDDDRSKSLDFEEFKKGLADVGAGFPVEEAKLLFSQFDRDGNGTISFDEFLVPLRNMAESRKKVVNTAFNKLDKTGDGVITVEDLRGVYNAKLHKKVQEGKWTEDDAFKEWLTKFDSPNDPDGKVTREEFMNYYAGLSASIDNNAYFDLMMRTAWQL